MAGNTRETKLIISAQDRATKELTKVEQSMDSIKDSVRAYGDALDKNNGSVRDFPKIQERAYKAASGVIKTEVDKMIAERKRLDDANKRNRSEIIANTSEARKAKAEAKAAADRVAALKAEQQAKRQAEATSAKDSKARIAAIEAEKKPHADRLKAIDKEIAVLQRLKAQRDKTNAADLNALATGATAKGKPLTSRQRAVIETRVNAYGGDVAALNQQVAAKKAAYDQEAKAQKPILDAINQRAAAERTLRTAERDAHAARAAEIRREINAQQALNREFMKEYNIRRGRVSELVGDRTGNRIARIRTDNALQEANRLAGLDRTTLRREARVIPPDPGSSRRGMQDLITETRRAGEAQRFLNGEVTSGNAAFSSAKSYILGLVSAYALFATSVNQAKQVMEAFNTKEAFAVAISATNGGDTSEAASQWDYLIASANKYKFAISGISDEYSKLVINTRGAGLTSEETEKIFEGVLAKARATNLTTDRIQNAFRALNQIVSKNQLYQEELKGQLAEAIPGAVTDMAKALGYSIDNMKQFNKDVELGKFGAEAVVKYSSYLLEQNSGAVEAAGNTFKAAVADLQNVLFETRLKLAEGGFMEGMKDTVQELTAFFRSSEGQAYMMQLSDAALAVVRGMAALARNLDMVIAGLGTLAGIKIAGVLVSVGSGAIAAAAGIRAVAGASGALAGATAALSGALGFLLRILGGLPGLLIGGGIAAYQMISHFDAKKVAETNLAMERSATVIKDIKDAANQAAGDVERFRELLTEKGLVSGSGMTDAAKQAIDDANKVMRNAEKVFTQTTFAIRMKLLPEDIRTPEMQTRLRQEMDNLAADLRRTPLDQMIPRIRALGRQFGIAESELMKLITASQEFDTANSARNDVLDAYGGNLEELSDRMLENGNAATRAAGNLKEYNKALDNLRQMGGGATAAADFASNLAQIGREADVARNSVQGMVNAARLLADVEKAVRDAQLVNASRFLEKQYGDAGLTLNPSPELVALIEGMNGLFQTVDERGQVAGWIPSNPGSGQAYYAAPGSIQMDSQGMAKSVDPVAPGLTVDQQALLNAIAAKESGGAYNIRFGGSAPKTFALDGKHPNIRERNPRNGTFSTAAGRYQFINSTYRGLMGDAPFTPENQDRAALKNAEQAWDRHGVKGVSLWDYIQQNGLNEVVLDALKPQWEAFTFGQARKESVDVFNSTRSRLMASNPRVGQANQTGVVAANPDGSISRGVPVTSAPQPSPDPLTPEQKTLLESLNAVMSGLPKQLSLILQEAVLNDGNLLNTPEFMSDVNSKDLNRIASSIEKFVSKDVADQFRRESQILADAQQARLRTEAYDGRKSAYDGMKFKEDDFADQAAQTRAVIRETEAAIAKMLENGASSIAAVMGTANDDQARALVRQEATQRLNVAYGEKLAEDAKKRAEEQERFNTSADKSVRAARDAAALAAVIDDKERERLQIQQAIANEQEDAGIRYTEQQIAARTAAEYARIEAEANAELTKSKREMSEADQQSLLDAQNRADLAAIEDERARERLKIEQELRADEAKRGITRTEAQRNALIKARMDAFEAEQGRNIAERQFQAKMGLLQSRMELLQDQLNDALENGDAQTQNRLKEQLNETSKAVSELNDEYIKFLKTAGGPGSQKAILDQERFGLEINRNRQKLNEMSPDVVRIGETIESSLNGAVDRFSQLVTDGVKPWDALKQSVSQAIGQILIDIGRMITQAIIADATMKALEMSSGTRAPAGGGGSGGAGQIFSAIGSIFMGGKFHDGGVIGDPSKNVDFFRALANLRSDEVPIIAQKGEEMLTRKDPRHRDNLGLSVARMRRFHTGGIFGMLPDTLGAKLGASGKGGALGLAFSEILGGGKPAAAALNPIYHIHNHFKAKDMLDQALSTPAGEKAILNVIAKNKSRLGMAK